ncbi:hypothetical protein SAMN05421788_102266 [Filimonas lacunae]|uniref:Uncharacterized protein n=1 Tax=Filimonas lacunae TaxID=477680 RepID=A0A173MHK6_9BACT|nr:hypothetical protein [Filimonas lacunae]BAV07103.1 hypothetical protein FLA_3123 [Filimonas lacunae]SIS94943.1 hypothetical protein SAMN05421788_102266 [Filimonas lacunae]
MKRILYLLLLTAPLISADCQKEGENCHKNILFRNESPDTVILAYQSYIPFDTVQCRLDGQKIAPGAEDKSGTRSCLENGLAGGKILDFYLLDPATYKYDGAYYNCDSLNTAYTILKEYHLTLDELRSNNFTITYP